MNMIYNENAKKLVAGTQLFTEITNKMYIKLL